MMGMDDNFFNLHEADPVIHIFYDPIQNIYYGMNGKVVKSIHRIVTPNDLLLFKNDPGYCIFPTIKNPHVLCELCVDDEWREYGIRPISGWVEKRKPDRPYQNLF